MSVWLMAMVAAKMAVSPPVQATTADATGAAAKRKLRRHTM
jgi:hypothetical protein